MLKTGVISILRKDSVNSVFERLSSMKLRYTQLVCWDPSLLTDEVAASVVKQAKRAKVTICALWTGYTGRCCWNFSEGPVTLGLVPAAMRQKRLDELKAGADFAVKIGAPAIITHFGFLPENCTDGEFAPVLSAIREIGEYCRARNLGFWFETGQETPVTLLRFIKSAELDNLGINLDPANLLMYGKGNPLDALNVFGKYVKNLHVKDGMPPTDPMKLGEEVQVGTGAARYPELIARLKAMKFNGEFIIEREIQEDDNQKTQILETVRNLQKWWGR